MKPSSQVKQTLSRLWKKRFIWIGLGCCVFVAYALFSWRQGMEEAALSVAGNIIASAMVGIALLLFWDKLLRKTTFFPSDEVSFLTHRRLSRKELAAYEAERYRKLLQEKIEKIYLNTYPNKKLFSFLLMGPEQSGKTSFSHFVNSDPKYRRKYLALEVPYAAIASNPTALDEVFHWLCDGDEGERYHCRIIVFHAGNSVRQVNELVEKLKIIQERFRKLGGDGENPVRHRILLMVQFTGRRPLEAISADFNWDEVLDGTLPLNYIEPEWILKRCSETGGPGKDFARSLYLHTLGVPDWYNALKDARTMDELFQDRWQYLKNWFSDVENDSLPKTFWSDVVQTRCTDTLPFRFLANTYLLENVYRGENKLADSLNLFLEKELPSMDLVTGRRTVRLLGQKFFDPLSEAFLLYHGFLPIIVRMDADREKKTFREMVSELMDTILAWRETEGTNEAYLRRRLLMEFFISFNRYISTCEVRIDGATLTKLKERLSECFRAVIDEKDGGNADTALALSLIMGRHGEIVTRQVISDLENLAHPDMVKLTRALQQGENGEGGGMELAQRILGFASLCDELYPERLPRVVEILLSHAGSKLYHEFVLSHAGNKLCQEYVLPFDRKQIDLLVFHQLEECIRAFRRLACRSQDVFLINKLVELDALHLAFAHPTGYAGMANLVQKELTEKYAFFYDSKDFLECRSWLRKTLCNVQIAEKEWEGKEQFELPEYDTRWETILHPSELWMVNHAAQQAFLLSKHGHPVLEEEGQRERLLSDLVHRLNWYRNFKTSSSESVPNRFANELLFAQINYLTYRIWSKNPKTGWKELRLENEPREDLYKFCQAGIQEAQKKLWAALPSDPKERKRVTGASYRLPRLLHIAFGRGLIDGTDEMLWFVAPLIEAVGKVKAEDTMLFKGDFPDDRDNLVKDVVEILGILGKEKKDSLSGETISRVRQWLESGFAKTGAGN